MTEAEAALRELGLSRLGSGRLGAAALQQSFQRAEMAQGLFPCGSLTRRQIEGARLDALTPPLPVLARWLDRWRQKRRRPI